MAITPVPATRVSDQLIRTRLMSQLQFDQKSLFTIQTQVSTGRRILLPSEDAPAALRAISLQRLLERKEQVQVNLTTNQSFLSATDSSINAVSGLLADIRGSALSVVGTTSSDIERQAIATEVDRAIQQLVDTGNQSFRGRFLFSGSRTTVQPFQSSGSFVEYNGNEKVLRSYSDIDVLLDSSVHGNEVFGTISEPVRGSVDLNPVLTSDTLLSDLHGGLGINKSSISVSDGSAASVVDISSANTIGDVARLLELNPPGSRTITVSVKPSGLLVEIDSAGGGTLTISEVGGGTTAGELGILENTGSSTNPILGDDLDPILRLTTRLDDILGSEASTRVESSGANNDFLVTANVPGAAYNDVVIQMVDDSLLTASAGLFSGSEVAEFDTSARVPTAALTFSGANNDLILQATTAGTDFNNVTVRVTSTAVGGVPELNYDSSNKILTINLESDGSSTANQIITELGGITEFSASLDTAVEGGNTGGGAIAAFSNTNFGSTGNSGGSANTLYVRIATGISSAQQVVDAINAESSNTFSATTDSRDSTLLSQTGLGTVDVTATGTTSGGSGTTFDRQSGIQIINGQQTYDIDLTAAETVEDLLNTFNGSGAGVLAQINASGTGINVRSRLSGADFSIGENGGVTATQLGLRSFTTSTRLDDLRFGLGVQIVDGTDFTIVRNDNTSLAVDLTGAHTIGDVIDLINNHADNQTSPVVARLAEYGNGIELADDDPQLDGNGEPRTIVVQKDVGSLAAIHLGLIPVGAEESDSAVFTEASDVATLTNPNADMTFTARRAGTQYNGTIVEFVNNTASGDQALVSYNSGSNTLTIDVDPGSTRAVTVVNAVTNQVGGLFLAQLNTDNGPNDGTGTIHASDIAQVATLANGTAEVLTGRDVNPVEITGVFNTLIRLRFALEVNDVVEVQRSLGMLDDDLLRVNFIRAEIGARQQGMDVLQIRLETEEVELRNSLSLEIDVDFTKAISDLNARQIAFQASLQTTASMLQLTLLNFL